MAGDSRGTISILNRRSGRYFLVDSGADECVFPAEASDFSLPHTTDLVAANGTSIKTFGKRRLSVAFGPHHQASHSFWIATVNRPILGADFFSSHGIIIDVGNRCLITPSRSRLQASPTAVPRVSGLRVPQSDFFEALLEEFPSMLQKDFRGQVKHKIRHFIPTDGPPVHSRPRRLDGEKLKVAREEFQKMEKMGVVRRSDSPWASPLHVVPKSDGSWRPCGDYHRLNVATRDDRYPLPHIHDFNSRLAGATFFSVMDLVRGFHQIPMAEEDSPKTAIITPFGLFEFLRMLFGLKNAAQAFQRLMDGILRDVDCAFVYLDDILIASPDRDSHLQRPSVSLQFTVRPWHFY